jgi:AcrR family transcriptional regulator
MPEATQGGTLARTHEGKPGLPRGRNRLPTRAVHASQRERLLRATVAAVAEADYAAVTVADIVRRAKVSRAAFYIHFRGKEDCFLAATREGMRLLLGRVFAAASAVPPGDGGEVDGDEEVLRAGFRAFLRFLADEPAFARAFYINMSAAGPAALGRLSAGAQRFAEINRRWHERARTRHPEWPIVPFEGYLALTGATTELVRSAVRTDRVTSLSELEDTLVSLHLSVLAGRPWGQQAAEPGAGEEAPAIQ